MNAVQNPQQFLTQRSGMTHARWRQVQSLCVEPRVFHASSKIVWTLDPKAILQGIKRQIPIVHRDLGTYDIGRNKAKHERRAALSPI